LGDVLDAVGDVHLAAGAEGLGKVTLLVPWQVTFAQGWALSLGLLAL
jgi:hypothetical protein